MPRPEALIAAPLALVLACSGGPSPTPSSTAPAPTSAAPTAPAPAVPAGKVVSGDATRVPYILWGGDVAAFHANGGLKTLEGSLFAEKGLVLEFFDGNDFAAQVQAYKAGTSPFLRGTPPMIARVAPELCGTPDTCPLPLVQMTWSTGGDHLVSGEAIKTLADLKGKRLAVQKGGPHEGYLVDVLTDARLKVGDVQVVFMPNVTGPGSPAESMQKGQADAAFVITPDMLTLTAGGTVGTGAEGSVKGAHDLVSTAQRTRSIPDLYYVNPGWWTAHTQEGTAFVAAYLRGVEEAVDLIADYNADQDAPKYLSLLKLSQDIFGATALPTLESDAHGLMSDCSFVGHPGNVSFFTDEKNATGWSYFNSHSGRVAVALGHIPAATALRTSPVDWAAPVFTGYLTKMDAKKAPRFDTEATRTEIEKLQADGVLDENTVLAFSAAFDEDQTTFDSKRYGDQFQRTIELTRSYTRAPIVIRGHVDSTRLVAAVLRAGMKSGQVKQSGNPGNYQYFMEGRPLDLENARPMMTLVNDPRFNQLDRGENPTEIAQAAVDLSLARAEAVRDALLAYASSKGTALDGSQIQVQGVGAREPLVVKPRTPQEAAANRRVEFSIVRVSAEALSQSDLDL
jgi:ABC-type nitrate/sulfonate/bicarbonate transport system substrate-binding protein/outer membrane protein OmpA-like peptidoglycan-associated protein